MKPFSQASENNKQPLLSVLAEHFKNPGTVLEIGSGTGQHAVFFGRHLPHLCWQTSDLPQHHAGIEMWLNEAALDNVCPPLALDVNQRPWPIERVDGAFSANTAHIMSWPSVCQMVTGVAEVLASGGQFLLYGPFNYEGRYTSDSNAQFDRFLRSRDPLGGIRDFEAIDKVANDAGMTLSHDVEMPSNNRTLVWAKR